MSRIFCGLLTLALGMAPAACLQRAYHAQAQDVATEPAGIVARDLQLRLVATMEEGIPAFASTHASTPENYLAVLAALSPQQTDATRLRMGEFMASLLPHFPAVDPSLAFSHFLANREPMPTAEQNAKFESILMLLCSKVTENGPSPQVCQQQTPGGNIPLHMEEALKGMENDLLKAGTFGRTTDGRPIAYAEITDRTIPESQKPAIWLSAGIHGNEVVNIPLLLEFAHRLSTPADPLTKGWLQRYRFFVVPLLNPDGFRISSERTSWRKNSRRFGPNHLVGGVNLNRNFPTRRTGPLAPLEKIIDWNYAGENAASEPETQSIMAMVERIRPVAAIDYHSDAHMLLIPDSGAADPAKGSLFRAAAQTLGSQQLTEQNEPGKYRFGTSADLFGQPVGGTLEEWIWESTGALSFTVEHLQEPQGNMGSNSWPPEELRANVFRNGWSTLGRMLEFVERHSIRGRVETQNPRSVTYAVVPSRATQTSVRFPLQNAEGLLVTTIPEGPSDLLIFEGDREVKRIALQGGAPIHLGDISL